MVNIAIKQLGGCIVLAYRVIAWGIQPVASPCKRQRGDATYRPTSALLRSQAYSIFSIFSLSIS